jgi:hypothetical protein
MPNVAACIGGSLQDSAKTAVLNKLNEVRARHGLLPVSYDSSDDGAAAEAALYMVANKGLTHTPVSTGKCYSANAVRLAGRSNLYMSYRSSETRSMPSEDSVVGYLIDRNVSSLGHRRWILSPFLGQVGFGRVDGPVDGGMYSMASVLRVMGGERSNVSAMTTDFVAYPHGNYPSAEFSTSEFLSFSAIASKTSASANGSGQVSYAAAVVTVKNGSGQSLTVSGQTANYQGYGLPNSLQWKVAGLQANTAYTVTISGVSVNGVTRQFQYPFRLQ